MWVLGRLVADLLLCTWVLRHSAASQPEQASGGLGAGKASVVPAEGSVEDMEAFKSRS